MNDIQGPFTDLRTFLNGANLTDTNIQNAGISLAKLVPLILYGMINGSTGAISNAGSGGWTSVKSGTGFYTVTFSPAFSAAPVVVASVNTAGAAQVATVNSVAAGSTALTAVVSTTGAGADANVMFLAIGAR